MTATIKKIAQLAGVSRGTVDRALNRRGGVNAETAARIIAIADELNYKPNLVAKSLSAKEASSIGILLSSKDNPFFDDVLEGIAAKGEEIKDFGFNIKIETLEGYNIAEQLEGIDRIIDAGVNGLILTPINRPPLSEKLKELRSKNIPVICLNTDVINTPRNCYVGSDYIHCGRVAAGMFGILSGSNPQKIAVVTGSFMILGHDLRVQGFLDCIKAEYPNIRIASVVECNDNNLLSYKAIKAIFETHPDLTGLFFSASGLEGGLDAVAEVGMLGKINIICVNLTDIVKKHLQLGNITATICQEPFKQGFEAVRVMFELLLAQKEPPVDIFTETQIVIRHSLPGPEQRY